MGAIGYSLSNETQSRCCGEPPPGAVSLGHAEKFTETLTNGWKTKSGGKKKKKKQPGSGSLLW